MADEFVIFGSFHRTVLALMLAAGLGFGLAFRKWPRTRYALGVFLAANELTWYVWRLRDEGFRFPEALPLQLCDLTLWCTVAACFTLRRWPFEILYFTGLSGTLLTVVTPDLWAPPLSYPTLYFFTAHGGVVASALAFALSGLRRPEPYGWLRALASVNLWALGVGGFNLVFGTNYMYLCEKPGSATLLDYFGPWPWYLAASEGLAVALFYLLWLPFRLRKPRPAPAIPPP
jgi:hypothetical integral membrane protein (TIGR02206 family)